MPSTTTASTSTTMQTEFRFRLPRGYLDPETGKVHHEGVMRLATARDEIVPLQDYRVQGNRAYLVIVLLARVITRLGDLEDVTVSTVENMFATDLGYLQELYRKINDQGQARHPVACPGCQHGFEVDLATGHIVAAGDDAGGGEAPEGPG